MDPVEPRAQAALGLPRIGPPEPARPLRLALSWEGRDYDVHLVEAGLACCSLEVMAAALASRAARADGRLPVGDGPVDVLVVSGTCTEVMAPLLARLHAGLGGPRVVSFGACAATGGPYWDSYSVVPGVADVVPVDLVVPGCPPPPEALLEALALLGGRP